MSDTTPPSGGTISELEGGVFNMVISLVQFYIQSGVDKVQACETVALMLDDLAQGLRVQ